LPHEEPVKNEKKHEMGMIHVYTGEGKGKTTSAVGLAMRAVGHGHKACVVQFMKGGRYFGELIFAEDNLPKKMTFAQFGQGCPHSDEIADGSLKCGGCRSCFRPFEEEALQAKKALKYASKMMKSGDFDLVILDEINTAMSMKYLEAKEVLDLMMSKPRGVELVLTGRGAPKTIIAAADYATDMKPLKHPFDKKKQTTGRRGVEY
jgi:cob(I)alamin adenosyltransferase